MSTSDVAREAPSPRPPTVAVIGGGIAGLSAAWALATSGRAVRVVVLESGARFGGKLHTAELGGRPVDIGPDAFVARRPEAVALCHELGLGDDLVAPGSRTAYVWARGRLRPLPAGLALGVPTRLVPLARSGIVSPAGVGRAALDALRRTPSSGANRTDVGSAGHGDPPPDRAVADIAARLGDEVRQRLVDPLIGGIHAGDTRRMSAAAVFPALLEADRRGGGLMRALRAGGAGVAASSPLPDSEAGPGDAARRDAVFLTVLDGLGRLVDRLVDALAARGVDLRLSSTVDRLELRRGGGAEADKVERAGPPGRWTLHGASGPVDADGVVIATPAPAAARLLGAVDDATAALLAGVEYADVTVVTLRLPEGGVGRPLDGTGFLVPAVDGKLVTACTWLTSKWPQLHRRGDVLLRASAGRAGDDRHAQLSDGDLTRRVLEELDPMVQLRAAPLDVTVTRWHDAFPQYDVGHLARVDELERAVARLPAFALAGAALRGVGIPACIASGRRAASAVATTIAAAGQPVA